MIKYEYDIAFSYSHKNEELVKEIENLLTKMGWKCIRLHHKLKELSIERKISEVFMNRARFIIVFISDDYNDAKSKWINLELKVFKQRYIEEKSDDFLLPIILYESLNRPEDLSFKHIPFFEFKVKSEDNINSLIHSTEKILSTDKYRGPISYFAITTILNILERLHIDVDLCRDKVLKSNLTEIDGNKILSLDLSNLNIKFLPFGIFDDLTNLKSLILHKNELTKIPEDVFKNLANLEKLSLYGNKINKVYDKSFAGLKSLNWLSLNYNPLIYLSENTFGNLKNLKYISLRMNFLFTLPKNIFKNLSNLTELYLNFNNFTTQLHEDIFRNLKNLIRLEIRSSKLQSLPENLFKNLKKLKILNLSNNNIRSLPTQIFSPISELEILNLSNNSLVILDNNIFEHNLNLTNLYFENNKLFSLPKSITRLRKLRVLNLQENKDLKSIFKDTALVYQNGEEIYNLFSNFSKLEVLEFGKIIKDELIGGVFQNVGTLFEILKFNPKVLVEAGKELTTLEEEFTDIESQTNFINSKLSELEPKYDEIKPILEDFNLSIVRLFPLSKFFEFFKQTEDKLNWNLIFNPSAPLSDEEYREFTKSKNFLRFLKFIGMVQLESNLEKIGPIFVPIAEAHCPENGKVTFNASSEHIESGIFKLTFEGLGLGAGRSFTIGIEEKVEFTTSRCKRLIVPIDLEIIKFKIPLFGKFKVVNILRNEDYSTIPISFIKSKEDYCNYSEIPSTWKRHTASISDGEPTEDIIIFSFNFKKQQEVNSSINIDVPLIKCNLGYSITIIQAISCKYELSFAHSYSFYTIPSLFCHIWKKD